MNAPGVPGQQQQQQQQQQRKYGSLRCRVAVFWLLVTVVLVTSCLLIPLMTIVWTAAFLGKASSTAAASSNSSSSGNRTIADDTVEYDSSSNSSGNRSGASLARGRVTGAGLDLPWAGGAATFNWHPLLMAAGFLPLLSLSLLSYRILSRLLLTRVGTRGLKAVHVVLHLAEMACLALGLVAVVYHKQVKRYAHFASLHSWMGLMLVAAFLLQFQVGVVFYLLPRQVVGERPRQASVHYHRLCGAGVFLLACATVTTGVTRVLDLDKDSYPSSPAATLGQAVGIALPILALLVVHLLTKVEYRRRLDPLTEPLLGRSEASASVRLPAVSGVQRPPAGLQRSPSARQRNLISLWGQSASATPADPFDSE